MDVESTITFPMEDSDWIVTVLIGGVVGMASILFFPIFLLNGFFVKVAREAMDGAAQPPTFGDWDQLFVDGIKASVIVFVYQLVPIITFTVVVGGSLAAMLSGSEGAAGAGLLGLIGGFTVYGVLALLFGYFGMAGLMNFVATDSLAAGFDFGTIVDVATDGDWMMAWAYVVGINIAFSIVFGVVGAIPFVGLLTLFVAPFATFYLAVVMYRIFGLGYAEATGTGSSATETRAAEPA